MRRFKARKGPFAERPYYALHEVDRMCAEELHQVGLYPSTPGPIRIDRFIEKRFGIVHEYDDLDHGVLGFTRFESKGVEAIVVSRALAEEGTQAAERRVTTTLAHEAGHGLLHGHLFALENGATLFGNPEDPTRILCRDGEMAGFGIRGGYDGRWWEFQANKAIGGLLLPRDLVAKCLEGLLDDRGIGGTVLPAARREVAGRLLAEVFEVNPVVARIRLDDLYPAGSEHQLTF